MPFLFNGPRDATATLLLAHGAGAPMDSASMTAMAEALAATGLHIARFEFTYMAGRRTGGRKPPPRAERLMPEFAEAVRDLASPGPLIIGGKSMGGRVASMIADDEFAAGRIRGLLCLGYPFHPPGQPQKLRTAHLTTMKTPTLICQGTRDPFGGSEEVSDYPLSRSIRVEWLEDGDHDFKPRKTISGLTVTDNIRAMAAAVRHWVEGLGD